MWIFMYGISSYTCLKDKPDLITNKDDSQYQATTTSMAQPIL